VTIDFEEYFHLAVVENEHESNNTILGWAASWAACVQTLMIEVES